MTEQELLEDIAKVISGSRCEVCNDCGASISTDDPADTAKEIHAIYKEAGYTCQPEPPVDKVEAIKEILLKLTASRFWSDREAWAEVTTHEILKLFPEYEPVELEALGDEEIRAYSSKQSMFPKFWSQETIRHNQAKGQLFRVKE